MAELTEEIRDVSNSKAFKVLENLHKESAITKVEMDLFKERFAKLNEAVVATEENKNTFLQRTKQLNTKLRAEQNKLEKTTLESYEDQNTIQQLEDTKNETQVEMDAIQERDMILQIQLSEAEHEQREKESQLAERDNDRKKEAEPKIQKFREEIDILQKEIDQFRQQKESAQERLKEFTAKCTELEQETKANRTLHDNHDMEYKKIKNDPERIRKQAEKFENAVAALESQREERIAEIEEANEEVKRLIGLQKDAETERNDKKYKVQMVTTAIGSVNSSCDEVKKKLDYEKSKYTEALMRRQGLEREHETVTVDTRLAAGELARLKKQLERLKRQHKKTQSGKETIEETMGPLVAQKKDVEKEHKLQEEEIKRQKRLLDDIQAEVDLFIGAYLKQEQLEKDKKEEYDSFVAQMEDMQKELKGLTVDEQRLASQFKTLASQREKLARDASVANRLSRETSDEVAMKQLEEDDLRKKEHEISQKQKEYCTMYEIVKNEGNKTFTNIQRSSQHYSEMQEKFKILQNEVEILKMESAFKDQQLRTTQQEAQKLEVYKDQLESEKTKISGKGSALNEQVEQYVIEIDKLNSIINAIEKEMVVLRRKYEQAVETRNFTGTQLIDRNDELCILWEKSNIQEKLLKKGEEAMNARSEEIRSLKIDLGEVERQLKVIRGQIPEVPKYVDEVVRLRDTLTTVRRQTDELSRELENPKSSLRKHRQLGGEDLDPQALRLKIQDLEERLNDKKESLLEKELILEEVTALSDKLRQQASDGRQGTMELSQKVNFFQARIKEVTRKMMATVSELSMHQATAHKLSKERDEAMERAMTARERLANGQPPADNADAEFEKILQMERQKELMKQAAVQRKQEEDILNSNVTRTTADPRVNAYIPEDEHGLPKAYGNAAPFKPTVQGSTMRHIRKPNPKPIEI